MMGVVQLRNHTEGRAYYDRKVAAGKSPNEAMRCLKRRLSDIVYRALLDDYVTAKATGPGGHRGATHQSSAAGSHPHTSTSDKPLPGPVTTKPYDHPAKGVLTQKGAMCGRKRQPRPLPRSRPVLVAALATTSMFGCSLSSPPMAVGPDRRRPPPFLQILRRSPTRPFLAKLAWAERWGDPPPFRQPPVGHCSLA